MEIKAEITVKDGKLEATLSNGKDKFIRTTGTVLIDENDKELFNKIDYILREFFYYCPTDYNYKITAVHK